MSLAKSPQHIIYNVLYGWEFMRKMHFYYSFAEAKLVQYAPCFPSS